MGAVGLHPRRHHLELTVSRLFSGLSASLATTLVATSALALAGGLAPAGAAAERQAPALSNFGYRADVYGVKLVTDNVEAFNVKDAHAQLRCTRAVGQSAQQSSALSVPNNPLVNIAASTSRTETYKEGATNGVRGVSTIADIRLGGEVGGVRTPTLVIEGLTTTADAFHTPQGFGHAEAFDFASIRLELLQGTPLEGTPLEALLAPLDQVSDTVFEGTDDAANEIFKVLQSATAPIEIPGLGTIALGKVRGTANAKKATSEAMALEILVDAGGSGSSSRSARPTPGSAPRRPPASSGPAARPSTCRPCRARSASATSSASRSPARAPSARPRPTAFPPRASCSGSWPGSPASPTRTAASSSRRRTSPRASAR